MSIAEKLNTVGKNQQKVYDAGKKAEYDRFWDEYQANGNRTSYALFFAGYGWDDDAYNPKYPIVSNVSNYMFWQNTYITDTKVDITLTGSQTSNAFASCSKLKTIHKLIVSEALNANMFTGCNSLENITFEGVIVSNLNMKWCPLTNASVQSIIDHLKDQTGQTPLTLTLKDTVKANLTEEQLATITGKNWSVA